MLPSSFVVISWKQGKLAHKNMSTFNSPTFQAHNSLSPTHLHCFHYLFLCLLRLLHCLACLLVCFEHAISHYICLWSHCCSCSCVGALLSGRERFPCWCCKRASFEQRPMADNYALLQKASELSWNAYCHWIACQQLMFLVASKPEHEMSIAAFDWQSKEATDSDDTPITFPLLHLHNDDGKLSRLCEDASYVKNSKRCKVKDLDGPFPLACLMHRMIGWDTGWWTATTRSIYEIGTTALDWWLWNWHVLQR